MTAPNSPSGPEQSHSSTPAPTIRASQVVTFRTVVNDLEVLGHALVLRVIGDLVHLAVLGTGGHVQVPVDAVTPAKVSDVPNPLPAPDAPAEGAGS